MHKISRKGGYFIVEVLETGSFESVIAAISDAFSQPNYFQKNNVFIFTKDFFNIQIEQLELITQYIEKHYPPNLPPVKSALVVPAGFNTAIVEVYVATARRLPYETQIFSNLATAESWVLEPTT